MLVRNSVSDRLLRERTTSPEASGGSPPGLKYGQRIGHGRQRCKLPMKESRGYWACQSKECSWRGSFGRSRAFRLHLRPCVEVEARPP